MRGDITPQALAKTRAFDNHCASESRCDEPSLTIAAASCCSCLLNHLTSWICNDGKTSDSVHCLITASYR